MFEYSIDGKFLRKVGGLFICLSFLISLSSCEKAGEISDPTVYEATIIFPPCSLGDNGFYDKLLHGITDFEDKHPGENYPIVIYTPYDRDQEKQMYIAWFNSLSDTEGTRKLLIVPNEEALDGLGDYVSDLPENNDVLLFSEKSKLTALKGWHHTFLDEYSVAFKLGQYLAEDNILFPVKIKVSGQDYLFNSVEKGLSDGYYSIKSFPIDSVIIEDSDSIVKTMNRIYSFVDDICEKSQYGTCIIPLLGEYQNIFYYYDLNRVLFVGIDVNIDSYVNCLFSIVRHYDLLLYDRLNEWALNRNFTPYERCCNDEKYIEWHRSSFFYDKMD